MHAVLTATASFALCLALYVSASGGIFEISRVFRANIQTYLNLGQSRAPWSHEPYCPSERYCVYTFNTTSSDSVSLIFTPANAEKAKKTLQKTNVSELTQDGAEEAKAWRVVDIPAKDKGVIATRKIEKYETIMVDHAAVIMDVDVEEELTSNLLKVAVNRLHQANTIHALGASTSKGTLEQRIMKTNAFGTTVAGVGSKALFPLVSRINHACAPNAYVLFSPSGLRMSIRASVPISVNEEITISYLPIGIPSRDRTTLLAPWGFTCTCALCSLPAIEKRASDIRRMLISQAERKVIELAGKGEIDQAISLARESVGLIGDEGVESMWTDEYAMLAMLYLEKGDRDEAEKWGKLAWDILVDMGHVNVDMRDKFELDTLLENIGGLGGDGKGKEWKDSGFVSG